MKEWEHTLDQLLNSGSIGVYQYCRVDQIVLVDQETNIPWNYFTNVHFSKKYTETAESQLLCSSASIRNRFKVYVSRYTMEKERFKSCVYDVLTSGFWNYTDSKINEADKIDGGFISHIKYVAENDPTGSTYRNVIPLEKSLYGSNFMGNYYLFEIYGRGDELKKLLTKDDRQSIQKVIRKGKLNYQLDKLNDRIGNIVCKFQVESLSVTPIKLGPYGTEHKYEIAEGVDREYKLHFHIEQEHDGLLYRCSDEDVVLRPGKNVIRGVEPNQCKTTITVTDAKTDLILFRIVSDQSVYSNYRGQITPDTKVLTFPPPPRVIKVDDKEISIPLSGVRMCGNLEFLIEMDEASKRQQRWEDDFYAQGKYLNVYHEGEHEKAISDIREILNKQLLWDLNEICIIDPYLTPKDILSTVVYCQKENLCVRCLTSIRTMQKNESAKMEVMSNQESSLYDFDSIKTKFRSVLESALGAGCDFRLSYRTIHGNNGVGFHDRYLILKYDINKTRVWSLGTSINSVGKSHHIIQIVESPTLIEKFFDNEWEETEADECKIYDYSDYVK